MRFILAAITALSLTLGCASIPDADAPAPTAPSTTSTTANTHPNAPCTEDEDRFDAPGGIICRHFEGDGERFIPNA